MKYLSVFLCCFCFSIYTTAALTPGVRHQYAGLYVGTKHGFGSSEFMRIYRQYFGGRDAQYANLPCFGAYLKFEPGIGARLGACAEFYQSNFADSYSQQVLLSDSTVSGTRYIGQNFSFEAIPIVATFEWAPESTQFRTYFGSGVGICLGKLRWTETITTTAINDSRTGGTYIDENQVAPAFCLYTGVELGFDKKIKQTIFAGLSIEARYTYVGLSAPYFQKSMKQFSSPPQEWKNSVYAGASGISLNIGLFFQFIKEQH